MNKKASLVVVYSEHGTMHSIRPQYVIGWDNVNVASSAVASFVEEALCDADQRPRTLERFAKAKLPGAGLVDLISGNGPNAEMERDVIIFDHDYFPEKKALVPADVFLRIVAWLETLEAMGFPDSDADYPVFVFEFISQGPQAEKEFLLATGNRWPNS